MKVQKYKITKLDARYRFCKHFAYIIEMTGITPRAARSIEFYRVMQWFQSTYGYSAEVSAWVEIREWMQTIRRMGGLWRKTQMVPPDEDAVPDDVCSPHWSWSIGRDNNDLRIYCASEKEVAFFRLAHKLDQ